MTKPQEKKYIKAMIEAIGDDYTDSDMILIQQVIDYLKLKDQAVHQLVKINNEDEKLDWVAVTTIATCTKNINLLMMSLAITPKERKKLKMLMNESDNSITDLHSILNN
jgi:hypothetical protein